MDRQRTAPIPATRRLLVETPGALRLVERVAPGTGDTAAAPGDAHLTGAVGSGDVFLAEARMAGLPVVALTGDPWLDHGRVRWLADAPGRTPEAVMHDRAAMCALREAERAAHLLARGRSLPGKVAHRLMGAIGRRPPEPRDPARSGCPVPAATPAEALPAAPSVSVVIRIATPPACWPGCSPGFARTRGPPRWWWWTTARCTRRACA
ncbi:MAG: hypothetical protein U0Y82_04470 [Thermoleophilia bacterium]